MGVGGVGGGGGEGRGKRRQMGKSNIRLRLKSSNVYNTDSLKETKQYHITFAVWNHSRKVVPSKFNKPTTAIAALPLRNEINRFLKIVLNMGY